MGYLNFSKAVLVGAFFAQSFCASAMTAIPPELDVASAYDKYLDEKGESDLAYQRYLEQKAIYDPAQADVMAAEAKASTEEGKVAEQENRLDAIDKKATSTESQRTANVAEVDRIGIQIGSLDNQLAAEQTVFDRIERNRDGAQRKLDQLDRRVRDLESKDNGSDWTCVWVDHGKEEHRGGHPATHADRSEADRLAKESCEAVHKRCVSRGCNQPDSSDLKRVKRERDDQAQEVQALNSQLQTSQNKINSLNADRTNLVNRDVDLRNTIREQNDLLAQLDRDRVRISRDLANADASLQVAQTEMSQARAYLKQVTPAYETARLTSIRESAETDAAAAEWRQIDGNYKAALAKVLAAADSGATLAASKEAGERAVTEAESAAEEAGLKRGREQATDDIKGRDLAAGYAEARHDAVWMSTYATEYQAGVDEGVKAANSKAAAEDFAKGFNEAFAQLLSNPPENSATLDAEVDTSTETPESGTVLVNGTMKVGNVNPPKVAGPAVPILKEPSIKEVSLPVVTAKKTYYAPACNGLVLDEFEPKCEAQYEATFQKVFAAKYAELYKPSYRNKYNLAAGEGYREGVKAKNTDALEMGRKQGVSHRGVLDGYADRLAKAQTEQKQAGQGYLDTYLQKGALLVVRSGSLMDTSGDGLLSPGEKAGVDVVIDNYGKQSTKNGALDFKVSKVEGLNAAATKPWLAIPPATRLTMKNTFSAKVVSAIAGSKLRVEGGVLNADGASLGNLAAGSKVGFAYQLDSIELERKPKIDDKLKAKFIFSNQTATDLPETELSLRDSPAFVEFDATAASLKLPAIAAGKTAEVIAMVKVKNFVGENSDVQFFSDVGKTPMVSQLFPKRITVDRTASLLLWDSRAQPITDSTLRVVAGTQLTVGAQMKYNRTTALSGPFVISAGQTSDKAITIVSNTASSVNFGSWDPSRVSTVQWFRFNIPASLKGKRAWVMLNLSEGSQWLHLASVYLDVQ